MLYSRFFFGHVLSRWSCEWQPGILLCCWNYEVKYHQCLTAGGKMYCDPGMVDQASRVSTGLDGLAYADR